ncbi:hypothetical protein M752DRAFT_39702 [Aspergillus phoenicis ATCC 13157]|uniref:Uncharacterized protein n=1 Tax=Aspergillus phoenicis ATCC 13157 TaxID=1353007 RepID=A0A370PD96_ASPPH|nr:hypothetical protein M752DRAFT_39702 [Aspergillus phoenicis ATCC 13157]
MCSASLAFGQFLPALVCRPPTTATGRVYSLPRWSSLTLKRHQTERSKLASRDSKKPFYIRSAALPGKMQAIIR